MPGPSTQQTPLLKSTRYASLHSAVISAISSWPVYDILLSTFLNLYLSSEKGPSLTPNLDVEWDIHHKTIKFPFMAHDLYSRYSVVNINKQHTTSLTDHWLVRAASVVSRHYTPGFLLQLWLWLSAPFSAKAKLGAQTVMTSRLTTINYIESCFSAI
jgi:hypothetical protein